MLTPKQIEQITDALDCNAITKHMIAIGYDVKNTGGMTAENVVEVFKKQLNARFGVTPCDLWKAFDHNVSVKIALDDGSTINLRYAFALKRADFYHSGDPLVAVAVFSEHNGHYLYSNRMHAKIYETTRHKNGKKTTKRIL